MEYKKIIPVIIIAFVIIIAAVYLANTAHDSKNMTKANNTTNITNATNATNVAGNVTNNTINKTTESSYSSPSSADSQQSESDPAYGTDEYVKKWDESEAGDGNWAYTHDQPVMTDDDGNRYARVYSEDSHESSWRPMNPQTEEESLD